MPPGLRPSISLECLHDPMPGPKTQQATNGGLEYASPAFVGFRVLGAVRQLDRNLLGNPETVNP